MLTHICPRRNFSCPISFLMKYRSSSTPHTTTGTSPATHRGHYRVPGEIKRREVELDPQPRRDHEQGGGAGLRKLDFFRIGLFLNSSATDIVFVTLPKHGS